MTGVPFLIVFVVAIVVMIVMISKFKIHPFLSILLVSLVLGLIGGFRSLRLRMRTATPLTGSRR